MPPPSDLLLTQASRWALIGTFLVVMDTWWQKARRADSEAAALSSGGAELAAEVGAVSADHLGRPTDDGIMAMARKDVIGVLLPGTPYSSMSKDYADGRRLIDLGVPIALGTDLNPNCWNESMQFTISLACHKMRMTPAEPISASTMNAAAALGLEKKVGSLEYGKKADILIVDVPRHSHIPYRFGTNLCSRVLQFMLTSTVKHMFRSVDSRRLYRHSSKLTTIFYRPTRLPEGELALD